MAKVQRYDGLTTSELARLTRERGLEKPSVSDAGAWAAWLREQDSALPAASIEVTVTDIDGASTSSTVEILSVDEDAQLPDGTLAIMNHKEAPPGKRKKAGS